MPSEGQKLSWVVTNIFNHLLDSSSFLPYINGLHKLYQPTSINMNAAVVSRTYKDSPQAGAPVSLPTHKTSPRAHPQDESQETVDSKDQLYSDYESLMVATEINLTPYMQEQFMLFVSHAPYASQNQS
jgi:hypothetical protein